MLVLAVGCGAFEDATSTKTEPSTAPGGETPAASEPAGSSSQATEPQPGTNAGGTGATPEKRACAVGFEKDVLPKLASSCGDLACHGDTIVPPQIDVTMPAETHAALMDFAFGSLEWSDPHPDTSGAREPELKKALDTWRLCGAPSN